MMILRGFVEKCYVFFFSNVIHENNIQLQNYINVLVLGNFKE